MTPARRRALLAAAAGATLGLGWTVPYATPFYPLSIVFLAPALRSAATTRQALATGAWFGLARYAVGAHFLLWLVRYSPFGIAFYLLAIAYILPFALVEAWFAHRMRIRFGWPAGAAIAVIYPAFEWVRTLGDTSFPADLLAHGFSGMPVAIAWTRYTGPTAVAVWIFATGTLLDTALSRRAVGRSAGGWAAAALGLWLAGPLAGLGVRALDASADGPALRLGIVQPAVPLAEKIDPDRRSAVWKRLEQLTREAAPGSDLVVWPETARPGRVRRDGEAAFHDPPVEALAREVGVPILYGVEILHVEGKRFRLYNGAAIAWPDGRTPTWYGKQRLLPFAEGIPFARALGLDPAQRLAQAGRRRSLLTMLGNFSPGPEPALFEVGPARIGVLICYEGLYSSLATAYRRAGANALAVLTNDAWWGRSTFPGWHARMVAARAVEVATPVFRAANDGISSATDREGRQIAASPLDARTVLRATIRLGDDEPTLYARTGDVAGAGLLLAAGAALLASGVRRRRGA